MSEIGPQIMRARTKAFALRVIKLFRALSTRSDAQVLGKQLLRSGTAVAANYRAACRSRSRTEFIAKMGVVVKEADESMLWIELLGEAGIVPAKRLERLHQEARELTAIFTATRQTTRARH